MSKGILQQGHISQAGRLFVPTVERHTPLFTVGRIAYSVGQRCVRKFSGITKVHTVKGKGVYSKGVAINNSVITNGWRYKYAQGA